MQKIKLTIWSHENECVLKKSLSKYNENIEPRSSHNNYE